MPAGPELDAALDAIDSAHLCHDDVLIVLEVEDRQDGRTLFRKFAALCAVGRFAAGQTGTSVGYRIPANGPTEKSPPCLSWSERNAAREPCFAEWIVTDLPQVHAGRLDRDKAWVFADYLHDLPVELQTLICAALVAPAADWTVGRLANRLRRMVLEADPEWAARRYRTAVGGRGVTAYLDQDATMVVTGHGLGQRRGGRGEGAHRRVGCGDSPCRASQPATLSGVMAAMIMALWVGTLVLTVLVLLAPIRDAAGRWAVRLGAVVSVGGSGSAS
jgi:hypothetical protein